MCFLVVFLSSDLIRGSFKGRLPFAVLCLCFCCRLEVLDQYSLPWHSFFFLGKGHVVFVYIVDSFLLFSWKEFFGTLPVCLSVCFETGTQVLFILLVY